MPKFVAPILEFFKHIWADAEALTPEQRKRSVRIACGVGLALVLIVLAGAGRTAENTVAAESPWWDAVIQARLALVRLILIPLPQIIGAFSALVLYQVIENSALGKRVLDDSRNRTAVLAVLLGSCILGYSLGVLR